MKTILGVLMIASFTVAGQNTFPSSGNVGIGTTSPQELLHLNGNIRGNVSGALRISSGNGTLDIGAQNSSWAHIVTDRSRFYFNASVYVDGGISSYGFSDLNLQTNGTTRMTITNSNGNVGIGTTSPVSTLHLSGIERNNLRIYRAGGTTNYLNLWQGTSGAVIDAMGTGLLYLGYDQSTNVILGYGGGNVGIGTASPDAKLAVSGQVHAQEVKVSIAVPGPDYVFEKDYKLSSLEEIKNYIDQNKHLPEVPSAKEMERNGVQLGEMNMLLLKKIEELTLYVIDMKKENNHQNNIITSQQREIDALKSFIKKRN